MKFRTIDLCAGIGGIRQGFYLTGNYENVLSAEIDNLACKTYEHLFGENPKNDITTEEFKNKLAEVDYDVLLAGFPCQTFSSVGRKLGFEDSTKGTIFFDIAKIIKRTNPKVVFLENVENLIIHDKGNTFKTIIKTLDEELDYKVIGYKHGDLDNLKMYSKSFIRNSKYFGVPQNRPRVYIIAFSRAYFGEYLTKLSEQIPVGRTEIIYNSLEEVLEKEVEARFFLSEGYLETLEKHSARQKANGNGFGYSIINKPGIKNPVANTLLATGGSGKERNLVLDEKNGEKYAGEIVKGKQSVINKKYVRAMTPTEWGRLQGFIGYGFKKNDGNEGFSFPEGVSVTQQYKQFGNSVTIPVVEEMAKFINNCINIMVSEFTMSEKLLFNMYGDEFVVCNRILSNLKDIVREQTIVKYFDMVANFKCNKPFSIKEISNYLGCTEARTYQIINQLGKAKCVTRIDRYTYKFN